LAAVGPGEGALVLIGFMGSGKSRAVRAAAAAGLETLDSDALLAERLGTSIDEFFAAEGEAEFRRREAEFVAELLDRAPAGAVVALGGGSVLSERVRDALATHTVAWLRTDPDTAWRRASGKRPLARDRDRFESLLAEREPIYEALADAVVPGRDDAPARALDALLALRGLPAGARMAWAASASGEYPAYVARGLLETGFWPLEGRRFAITDEVVGGLYADKIEPLGGMVEVAAGEQAKSLAEAERVLRELTALGATRSDHIAALGGGVVGDLGGLCAALYQRGVPVVQVPTTLVAQVDSAYGGKTGVDLPEAKNYVGAYHLPAAVLADPGTLTTLPREELAAGFVEVLKTGLIAGGRLWEQVRAIEELDPVALDEAIFACVRTKLEVVAADERDTGARASLNLGHTVGHAIEAASGYARYRHGEAVGLGLLAALQLSDATDLRDEVEAALVRHRLPTALDDSIDVEAVLEAIGRDKKATADGVGFVLCHAPGEVTTGERVDPARVREAVEELRE
jgi:shikimate kinase / 3-dehydroquinate synthase